VGELLEFIRSQKQTLPQLLTLFCRLLPYTTPITSEITEKNRFLPPSDDATQVPYSYKLQKKTDF